MDCSNNAPLKGASVTPEPITGRETAQQLLDKAFPAFVGRDLRNAYYTVRRAIKHEARVFATLSGAMTPAGLHFSCLIPLVEAGLINSLTTTGANCYHDIHRVLGDVIHEVNPYGDDLEYRDQNIIRIFDLGFDEDVLFRADEWFKQVLLKEHFQRRMGVVEMNWLLGREIHEYKKATGISTPSLLETCYLYDVPVFVGAPQDGSIFLQVANLKLRMGEEFRFELDPVQDVLDMAGLQYWCHNSGKPTAVLILGGGVPKNFTLQGEPMVCQFLMQEMKGFDYDVQFCVDVVDNGALSSCPAGEAHTWGKTSAECVQQNSVYCRTDLTVSVPLVTAALLGEEALHRTPERLYGKLPEARELLRTAAMEAPASAE